MNKNNLVDISINKNSLKSSKKRPIPPDSLQIGNDKNVSCNNGSIMVNGDYDATNLNNEAENYNVDGGDLEVARIALRARRKNVCPENSACIPCEGGKGKFMNKELADDFLSVVS